MDADSGCYTVPILVVVDRLFDLISDIKLVNGADGILDSLSPIFSPQTRRDFSFQIACMQAYFSGECSVFPW